MAIEYFKSEDGMLTVDKSDGQPFAMFSAAPKEKVELNAADVIETAFTYQDSRYAVLETNNKGKCEICGAETEYSNRHICPYCWGQYEGAILQALKEKNGGEVILV